MPSVAADVQKKYRKLLATPIKEEILEISTEQNEQLNNHVEQAASLALHALPYRHKWSRLHSPIQPSVMRSRRHNAKIKKSRSTTNSPTPSTWHSQNVLPQQHHKVASQNDKDNNNGFLKPNNNHSTDNFHNDDDKDDDNTNNNVDDDVDEHSSSSSVFSAISLTMKTERHKCDVDEDVALYQGFIKQEHNNNNNKINAQQKQQQQQDQQHHQQQEQKHKQEQQQQQQQQYLDELKQSAVSHQQQLTANLFMARTIALSRTRDFPELFQNSSAAAVAAAAAAAAAAANSSNSSTSNTTTSANYMLPCPLCATPLEQRVFRQHLDRHYPRDSPVCPVIECGRRFAHPNSVRNHMRIKHTLQWAKMKAMRSSGGPFAGGSDFK